MTPADIVDKAMITHCYMSGGPALTTMCLQRAPNLAFLAHDNGSLQTLQALSQALLNGAHAHKRDPSTCMADIIDLCKSLVR